MAAQSFPNGTQTLNCCDCESNGCDLVADSEPAPFNTADLQGYILVDVDNSAVDGDNDDDLIDAFSVSGTFSNVPAGDYVIYYISYNPADAATLAPYFASGQPIGNLLALGTFQGDATWMSSDPSFIVIGSELATVNDPVACACGGPLSFGNTVWADTNSDGVLDANESGVPGVTVTLYDAVTGNVVATTVTDMNGDYFFTDVPPGNYYLELDLPSGTAVSPTVNDNDYGANGQTPVFTITGTENGTFDLDAGIILPGPCVDFNVVATAICSSDKTSYQVLLLFQGGNNANGYNILDNQTGATINNVTANSSTFGPFDSPDNDGFSYTVSLADFPECTQTVSVSNINCVVTAIELVDFRATAEDNGNQVIWTTASENEADYFTVEHSLTGADEDFQEVGTVKATGNSNVNRSYEFLHDNTDAGVHYYRLKETDLEGRVNIVSDVAVVERTSDADFGITSVYPIPTDGLVNVEFISTNNASITVEVIDIAGKIITKQVVEAGAGNNIISLDASNYAVGTYFVSITDGNNSAMSKFIKN